MASFILQQGKVTFCRLVNSTAVTARKMTVGSKTLANGVNIYYEKVGQGNHPILLIPGALGSTETDFQPQLKNLNRKEFTVVCFDPRGNGKSRPPERDFPPDFLYRDANDGAALMEILGFKQYSVVGWSDGGNSACILAANCPERVNKLVVWGSNAYFSKEELNLYKGIRDLEKWSTKMKQPMVDMYGGKLFEKMWHGWVDAFDRMAKNCDEDGNTDLYKSELPKITCQTLIVHGMKDALVPKFQPEFLHKNIKNSRLICWEDGKHNLHLRYAERFNALVEQFLTSSKL
uniref:Valacyclovir hydrolase-like n=1 Tax=Phallusia mammillata TaxID=59560 RepID=A0A6F9D8B8_9ASCI|nr:valacyclovir hydrolase-like [Phallusia mammillata]